MPLYLPPAQPTTRRQTLRRIATVGAGWLAAGKSACAAPTESRGTWLLAADTHIAEDKAAESRGGCMAKRLEQAVREMLRESQEKPFGMIVNGDCAFNDGQPGDYATLAELLHPLREAGIPIRFTLGNHDHRDNFMGGCGALDASVMEEKRPVEGKHVAVAGSSQVNWLLLDSLDKTDSTPGVLGEAQLGWIHRTLRDLPDRPVVVMVHHNPQTVVPEGKKRTGLVDTDALLAVIEKHRKVKAIVFGHTHNWSVKTDEATGLHHINLPPVGYPHDAKRPVGWVLASMSDSAMHLKLHSLNPSHPEHGQEHTLKWRA